MNASKPEFNIPLSLEAALSRAFCRPVGTFKAFLLYFTEVTSMSLTSARSELLVCMHNSRKGVDATVVVSSLLITLAETWAYSKRHPSLRKPLLPYVSLM